MVDAVIADCSPTNCGHSPYLICNRATRAALPVVVVAVADYVLLHVSVRVHALWARNEEGRSTALGKFTVHKT